MKPKYLLPFAAGLLSLPLVAQAAPQTAPKAKITKDQARAIALKAAPGEVIESDYEKENGRWRYSFDIKQGTRIHEIGVDAETGAIVEDSYENPGDKD